MEIQVDFTALFFCQIYSLNHKEKIIFPIIFLETILLFFFFKHMWNAFFPSLQSAKKQMSGDSTQATTLAIRSILHYNLNIKIKPSLVSSSWRVA